MGFDSTSVARGVGTNMTYKPLASGKAFSLPQRLAIFAQGKTGTTYPSSKFVATSAEEVATVMGYGSPAHLIALELFPLNGDGVGTIPVTFYPLQQHASGVVSAGDLTPSGTQSKQSSYQLKIGGVKSNPWVQPKGSVNLNNTLRAIANAVNGVLAMPVTVGFTYGTVTSAAGTNTGNGTCTSLSATGTPVPGAWSLVCTAAAVNGGTFKLVDPDGTTVSTSVSVSGSPQTAGGIQFTLADGATDFIVGDSFTITVPATKITFAGKWKGASSNGITIKLIGDTSLGTTFAITNMTGGLNNPTVDSALALVGLTWDTMFLNALDDADTTALDAFQTFGEGRWDALYNTPLYVFRGTTASTWQDASAISSTRKEDRVNVLLSAPGSDHLPFVVAAAQLVRIIRMANNNPPHGYGMLSCPTLTPGADDVQWTYAQRDSAIKAGCSTTEVVDGVVKISDVVTHYAPTGNPLPEWRYVVDGVKVWQLIYNGNLIFKSTDWASAPVVDDDQATTNPAAKTGAMARNAVNNLIDSLALAAVLRDPKGTKKLTTAGLDPNNPKIFRVGYKVLLAGNANLIPIEGSFALNAG